MEETFSDRSLIDKRNSKGLRTAPCGTPETTGTDGEAIPSTSTFCDLSVRKLSIHEIRDPLIP